LDVRRRQYQVTGENYMMQSLIHNFCWSPNIIRMMKSRRMEWVGYVACVGKARNPYEVMIGKLERKKLMGRPGHRWEGKTRMDLSKMKQEDVDCVDQAYRDKWQAVVNTEMHLQFLQAMWNFMTG
jgi:hypothetical protein